MLNKIAVIPALAAAVLFVSPLRVSAADPAGPPAKYATTTPTGLQYTDVVVGKGALPKTGQTVTVHYTGTLENGTKFDSSRDRGQPFSFVLGQGQVIPGWDEGLATMHVGGRRWLHIPSKLAYGSQGAGGVIPPDAPLIFDVELLSAQ